MRLLLSLICATAAIAAEPFSIRQVLSAPFPTELTRSPRADAIAWVINEKGVRNVWIAAAPAYEARAITHFTTDDGQEISEPVWSPNNAGVYFTRGSDPNSRGEIPNPTSDPAGAHQEIWYAPLSGGPKRLGNGSGARVSADGAVVAWVQSGQIWTAAGQLVHARGSAEQLKWAPAKHRLAFRSVRGDHSFIGIYDADRRTLQYLDPSTDRDMYPSWSADGREVAFVRQAAARYQGMHGAKRTGEPWSIRVVDFASGKARELFHAAEGAGSVYQEMRAPEQLFWCAGERIVFPWERDGWLHLYSIAVSGGEPKLLTPGEFEIEYASLTPYGGAVVYSSNQSDIDRRHLWQVTAAGTAMPRQLTQGTGVEWAPIPLAAGALARIHSDARHPARVAIGDRELTQLPSDFPDRLLVEPQSVVFTAADGMSIHGQVFLPPGQTGGRRPAVVFFHGGSRRQMYPAWHSMFYYSQAYGFNQYLASLGYVVLSVNYRSGIGYGTAFREALNYGPTGASEYNDVIGAGIYLKSRRDVDPARIGLWGGSYGGYLTALGLARASDMFAAGVDFHGVHDWNLEISNFVPVYEPEKRLDIARVAFRSSPMSSVDSWRSPVLLIHGDDDRNVVFAQTVQLAEVLRLRHVPVEELIFPDEVHDLLVFEHWVRAYTAGADFLQRKLYNQ